MMANKLICLTLTSICRVTNSYLKIACYNKVPSKEV